MNRASPIIRRFFFLVWLSLLVLVLALTARSAVAAPVEAGVARVNLTPPMEMKAALGGYGARESKPAVGVHDLVWAKALVLSRGDRKFALVTADVLGFPHGFKAAVMERLSRDGWSADQIMLLPSHSHTSFDLMALHPGNVYSNKLVGLFHKELFDHTADRLAEVVRTARKNPTPILEGAVTVSISDRNRNRRRGLSAHDTALTVTRIDTTAGMPLAVLINWTAHPTFMNEDDMLFSGDWPGHLQRTVEALAGSKVVAMYYNGAEGDQSPVPPPDSGSRWERAERYGREMGILAWKAWGQILPAEVNHFAFHTEMIKLPRRQWHPEFMKTGGAEYGLEESNMQAFVDQLNPADTHSTCLRIGDLEILGVPGEMASQLGMEIKSQARRTGGATCITIGGLADEWVSYVLSAEEYRKGGYEASMSFYGETLGNTLVEGVLRGASNLK